MRQAPEFLELTAPDCRRVLARNRVGRLAFVRDGVVDIEPIGYAMSRDWLFARSAFGAKLEALERRPFVALLVDEVDGPFDWRSVIVRGTIYVLPADGSKSELQLRRRAIAAIRDTMPEAFSERDATPERDIIYGLYIDRLEGRMAHQRKPTRMPPRARRRPRARRPRADRPRREVF